MNAPPRFTLGWLLVGFATATAAPVPKELRTGDLRRIAGAWTLTKAHYGEADFDSAIGTKWTLSADGQALRDRPNDTVGKATFKIDPGAGVKTFDWMTEEGNTFRGVYELEGDTFKVILKIEGGDRPRVCKPTDGAYCFEFRRGK